MISLIESLRNSESQPNPPSHVIIPMSRLLDNNEALNQNQPIEEANYSVKRLKLNNLRPKSPEEPQIGFRFSSQENFSNQMRYGRRSKLELLWRLGAIEKTRNFDKRFSEWEQAEKNLLRPEFYGSIKRVSSICSFMSGLSREKRVKEDVNDENRSKVHPRMRRGLAFLNPKNKPTGECFQAIVQEDFLRAGWILRLFSGDQSQEVHSSSALVRRSINRMKGIVLFLENLDEIVARGGMLKSRSQVSFGFDSSRLWTLNGSELFKLKKIMKYNYLDREEADIHKTLEQQKLLWEAHLNFANLVLAGESSALEKSEELDEVSKTIFLLAMADFLTGEHSFGDSAIRLVKLKFLDFQHFSLTSNMFPLADWRKELEIIRAKDDYDGAGYAFPIPKNAGNLPKWFEDPKTEALPFDPKTFDPALLFDGLRLLSSHWRVKESSTSEELPLGELKELFKIQTGVLLLDEKAFKKMYSTNTKCKSDILRYDIKLSALASFVDDARLLGRIANRSLVRLPLLFQLSKSKSKSCPKDEKIMIDLCQNFKAGLKNIKFHPFDEENHKLGLLCKELGVERSTN
ncbi:hypothetical protein BY996DRAFT_6800728 [Phakopsora pachyrhizi]|nr:hypothetical protein BY996DRAFT_6800728 [Phakopsora pachyrhizi]